MLRVVIPAVSAEKYGFTADRVPPETVLPPVFGKE